MTKQVCEISWGIGWDLDGTIDGAIKQLQKYKADGFTHLSWEEKPYEDGHDLYIKRFRDETPEETAAREQAEEQFRKSQEAVERRAYEELKKKFS